MISPTTSPQYFGTTTTTSGTTLNKDLDKDAFLKMLVEQLKHQDPLDPLKTDQLSAQLAQFSSLEQLTQIKDAVHAQTDASNLATLLQQTSLSASLIGREVLAVGDQVTLPSSGSGHVTVDVTGSGGSGTLTLTDSNGAVVATRDLGQLTPGTHTLTLPAGLPPGTWHYAIEVKDGSGATSTVTTYTSGVVDSIEFKNGSIWLRIGDAEIALSDLVRVSPGSSSTSAPAGAGSGGTLDKPGAERLPTGPPLDDDSETAGVRPGADRLPPVGTGAMASLVTGPFRLVGGVLHFLPGIPGF